MEQNIKKDYFIIVNNKIIKETYDDLLDALKANRTQYSVGSKVYKVSPDGKRTLLASNVSVR